jgi:hypothetical protein
MAGAGEDEGDEGEGEGVRAGEVAFVGVRRGCGCEGGLEGDMASEGFCIVDQPWGIFRKRERPVSH